MKKQLFSALLASALVIAGSAPYASAAAAPTVSSNGTGTVYSPQDIIDVVVPTDFKIAFNPLEVAVKNDDFNGSTQVLSGTYAIQNRSTVPVNISAAFTVSADGKTVAFGTAADVEKDNAAETKPTAAKFSLDLITTAANASQTLPAAPAEKGDAATSLRTDAAASGVKLSKASTAPISLTTGKAGTTLATTVDFMFNAGPYTPTYDKEQDKVIYKANAKGTWDTVAFKFGGTASIYADLWTKATAPSVKATYTLTESTPAAYASTPFSPTSKNIMLKTGQGDVTVSAGVADKAYTFAKKPSLTMSKDEPTKPADSQKVTLLNLVPNSKPDSTHRVVDFGTYAADDDAQSYTYTIKGDYVKAHVEAGFYKVTIGKQSFIMEVK